MAAHFPAWQRPLERPGKEEGRDSMLAQAFLSSAVAAPQPPQRPPPRREGGMLRKKKPLPSLPERRSSPQATRGASSRASSRARYGKPRQDALCSNWRAAAPVTAVADGSKAPADPEMVRKARLCEEKAVRQERWVAMWDRPISDRGSTPRTPEKNPYSLS